MDVVKTGQHCWQEFSMREVTPIGVMEDGAPAVVSMDELEVKIFCKHCGEGLTAESKDTLCTGEWIEEDDAV